MTESGKTPNSNSTWGDTKGVAEMAAHAVTLLLVQVFFATIHVPRLHGWIHSIAF
jgi:hypothetical protein